jgi:hypothetical protein
VSISRRGLLAIGLTAAVVGSIGVASMLNANADDGTDDTGTPAALVASDPASLPPGTVVTQADGTKAVVPPTDNLPWGDRPAKLKVGRMGASSAELVSSGAVAARDDPSRRPRVGFGPKGRFLRNDKPLTQQQTTVVQSPVPPAPPAQRGDPVIGAPKNVYYSYAIARQQDDKDAPYHNVTSDGIYANLYVGKPYLDKQDWHTLAEIAVSSADGQQTIEAGWNIDRALYGNDDPHLFVFNWVDGVGQGYNSFSNYVPATTASIKPAATLAYGTTHKFNIQHKYDADGGKWWIALDDEWIGEFPDSIWDNEFTQTGRVQFFGEVAGSTPYPCSQMGSNSGMVLTSTRQLQPLAKFGTMTLINPSSQPSSTDDSGKPVLAPVPLDVLSQPYVDQADDKTPLAWYPSVLNSSASGLTLRYGGNFIPTPNIKKCSGTPAPAS